MKLSNLLRLSKMVLFCKKNNPFNGFVRFSQDYET